MAQQKKPSGSLRIGRLLGIDVRVHWTFMGLLVLVVWADWSGGRRAVGNGLLWIVAIFGSVLVHELAHCVVARRRGTVVLDILLLPIGGLSQMEEIPEAPTDELAISVVGPLTSLAIGVLAVVIGLGLGVRVWPPTLFAGSWFARLAWLNFLLGGFNFLPALPMDGGRILRATLARHRDRAQATRLAGRVARFLAGVMVVVGFFYNLWLVFIGLFVLFGAMAEEQAAARGSKQDRPDQGDDR